ncbi:glycosyltransferase [Sphingomonas bacterium]|uniref:glycosyltransferase n=1 Tax=Sphingomonas bacterium TaxID=1895847 RepID=UPI00157647BB|nr:glycosyltransferase [Sphingomonas bacterium]
MIVGYFTNQYPKVSHTFIRREIAALEEHGVTVPRWALRGWDAVVADPLDAAELRRTRYLLQRGFVPLLGAALRALIRSPRRWVGGLRLTWRMMHRSERSAAKHLVTFLEAALLAREMRDARVDHLHVHFGTNAAEVGMIASALSGIPYSFTVHGPGEFDAPLALKLGLKIERASFVVAITDFCASQLFRWSAPGDRGKIHVVHCGLSRDFLDAEPTAPVAAARFVNVGRLCPEKAQYLLVAAVAQLKAAGTPVRLTLVGDGDSRAEVDAEIARLGLADDVTVTGWADEARVRAELVAARAMVMPSFAEGLPIVVMEAFALGRPVLAANVAAMSELVETGETGWLHSPGSVGAVVDAMAACMAATPEECGRMGQAGRARVRARHDAGHEAGKLLALIAASLGEDRHAAA